LLRLSDAGRAMFVSTGTSVTQGLKAYWGAYAVSKAALETLVKTYAAETVKTPLKVNIIDPGEVRTQMHAEAKPGFDPLQLPLPEEITDIFVELALPECRKHGQIWH